MSEPLLAVDGLEVRYAPRRWLARQQPEPAVQDVSFTIGAGEAFGLVGESGSGKTTIARVLAGLLPPSRGAVRLAGAPIRPTGRDARRALWRRVQYVHQNPRAALNPRLRVGTILGGAVEALCGLHGAERDRRVAESLERVGIAPAAAGRRPHAFSGGQAQRIAIARAIAVEPSVLLLDEPTSSLDVRVQAGVLALLDALRRDLGTTLLLISHDLPVVAALCGRMAVLRRGRLVETGDCATLLRGGGEPYTRELVASVPRLEALAGVDPSAG